MKVLFVNPVPEMCGVHQYGLRLYSLLKPSMAIQFAISSTSETTGHDPDVVIYNWHPLIDPPCEVIQRSEFRMAKKVIIYHDGCVPVPCDAVLYSCPGWAEPFPNWHMIGRPLPDWEPVNLIANPDVLTVGIAGFCGAWAADSVSYCLRNTELVHFRLHLPPSYWCDPQGHGAAAMAERCRSMLRPGDSMEVNHSFLSETEMLRWLSANHVNCYIRDASPSAGTSSATDNALAVRKPIAINKNPMFRHLFNCTPSICIEDTPIREIVANGSGPLIPHYVRNHRVTVRHEVEQVLLSL